MKPVHCDTQDFFFSCSVRRTMSQVSPNVSGNFAPAQKTSKKGYLEENNDKFARDWKLLEFPKLKLTV